MTQKYLQEAIHNKEVVSFTYLGVPRVVEPYLLGLNANGDITLCAWELSGDGQPKWSDFLINKIRGVSPTDLYFRKSRVGEDPSQFAMQHILAWVGKPVRNPHDLFF